MTYRIEERFQQLVSPSPLRLPRRSEFQDPLLASLQGVPLSKMIDQELDRFYNPAGPVDVLSRVFRRLRGQ
ncbi:MAG: hypothetical protein AB7N76_31590 [Planctomycetota bacterium]